MAVRIKDLQEMTLYFQEGFSGTSAIDDASIAVSDTVLGVDTHSLFDERTVVPIGARFTTAGIATVRTVTDTQNSTQYTLDLTAPTAGTFDITHNGNTAAGLAYDIADTALQSALEGLASIGAGNVAVTEVADVYTITFQGTLKNTEQTLTVDGSSLTAPNSEVFTQVQDGTTTWEITFSPAIATGQVPSDDDVITWYPRRLEFEVETGDFEWTEGQNINIRKPRGIVSGHRRGEEQEMEITTTFTFSWMRAETTAVEGGAESITPYEALKQKGFASDWLPSSHGSPCEPYNIDLVIEDRPQCGSEQAEVFIFTRFRFTEINPVVNDGVVNLSGTCAAIEPIIHRVANDDDAIGVLY